MRRPIRTAAFAAAAAALLSGCATLAPKYERPAAPVPASWPKGPAYPAPAGAPQAAADLAWRTVFTDPKLQAVIAEALANNRDLRVAVLNVAAARAQYQVQHAALFPTINGSSGLQRQHVPAAAFGAPGNGSVDTRLYSLTAGISQYQIDLFGQVRSLTKAAFEQYLASGEARQTAQITLIAETATDYLTLGADRERLQVAEDTLQAQQASLDLARGRFHAGVASELDLRQAETTVEQARAQVSAYTTQASRTAP